MNILKLVSRLLMITLFFILAFYSCSENQDGETAGDLSINIKEVELATEIDQMDNLIGDIVIEAFEMQQLGDANRLQYNSSIPGCVTVIVIIEKNYTEVTLDFGVEGCLVKGRLLRGQIVLDHTKIRDAREIRINYGLVDFFVDDKSVMGSRSILRERTNENGNPQFTHTIDITVFWPNGAQASREGTRVREWVKGFGSGTFSDNVFEITGRWTVDFVNGNTHSYEVQKPLRREIGCEYLVSGTVAVERTNFGGLFDYGDGECDNLATFTFNNNQIIDITL